MASASPSSEEQQRQEQQVKDCVHRTKLIQFLGRTTPIVLQNDNGPCPLLAICNVLLLRNNLNLSPDTVEVSQEKLLALVAERLIDSNSNLNNKDAGYVENQQQNISDAIDLLPRLATGIDVNIKFRRMDDFEFTPECAIFDLLDIPLYHGWIVDPQDTGTANAIGSKSYNALTGELVALETQNMEGLSQEDELIRNFLKNNASQLTINGLFCLRDGLKESVLCVFFRNNHFSTMFKFHGELYLLATDQGYINQPDLVWEKLNEVNGDTLFMTGNFKEFRAESRANDTLDGNSRNSQQSGSSDLQLAIALQQKESEQQPQRRNSQRSGSSDLQLAIALQQEESEQQPQRRNSRQSGCSDLQLAIALQQQESEQQPRRRNSQQSGSSDLQLAIALQQEESEQQPHRRNSQQSGNSDLQLAIALQQEESEQQPQRRNSQQSGCSDLQLAIALQQQESEQQPRRRNSQQSGSSDLQLAIALQQEESEQQPRRRNSQQSGSSDLQLAIALQQLESEQQPRRRNSQQSGSFDLQLAIALQQQESEQQPHRPSS